VGASTRKARHIGCGIAKSPDPLGSDAGLGRTHIVIVTHDAADTHIVIVTHDAALTLTL